MWLTILQLSGQKVFEKKILFSFYVKLAPIVALPLLLLLQDNVFNKSDSTLPEEASKQVAAFPAYFFLQENFSL